MNNCGEDRKTDYLNLKVSAKLLKILRYLKEPVEVVSELYNRYPDGGEWGWFTIVTSLNTIAIWNVKDKKWQPINAFGDFVQSDWEETDEESAAFIMNKPDLNAITTNEPYRKYYTDIVQSKGVYEIHTTKNLMYSENIVEDLQLIQSVNQTEGESYGTTYMLFFNSSDKELSITLQKDDKNTIHAIGFNIDEPLTIAPKEWIEIAAKNYGELNIMTCVYGKGIIIPEQVQSDWEETDENAKSFIRRKPDLTKLSVNEEYNKHYPDIVKHSGHYQIHGNKDLMYFAELTEDIVLNEVIESLTLPLYGTTYMLLTNPSDNDVEIKFHVDNTGRLLAIGFDIDEPLLLEPKTSIEIAVKGYGYMAVVTCIYGGESAARGNKDYYLAADIYPYALISSKKVFVHPTKEYNAILNIKADNTIFEITGISDEMWELTQDQIPEGYDENKCFGTTYLLVNNASQTDATIKLPKVDTLKIFPEDTEEIILNAGQALEMAFRGMGNGEFVCTYIYNTDSNETLKLKSGEDAKVINSLETVHVNSKYTGDVEDGSSSYPYKTLTKAFASAENEYPVFLLETGDYSDEGILTIDRDCMITSLFPSMYPIIWLPKLNITAEDVMINHVLTFAVTVNQSVNASLVIENCTIYQPVSITSKGSVYFKNCFFYFNTGQVLDTSNTPNSFIYIFNSFQASVYTNSGKLYCYNSSFVPLKNTGLEGVEGNDAIYITAKAGYANLYDCTFTYNTTWASDFSYRIVSKPDIIYVSGCELGQTAHIGINFIRENIGQKIYGGSTNARKLMDVIEEIRTNITTLQSTSKPTDRLDILPFRGDINMEWIVEIESSNPNVNLFVFLRKPENAEGNNDMTVQIRIPDNTTLTIKIDDFPLYNNMDFYIEGQRFNANGHNNSNNTIIEIRKSFGEVIFTKLNNNID